MRWNLLVTPPLDGADNMALDDALMERARSSGTGVVRVYSWRTPTLSLGRNQRADGIYSREQARALGVAIVRRATGGRALLHHREITYSVTAPIAAADEWRERYRDITYLLQQALQRMGVATTIATPAARTPAPGFAPCFELPVRGELTVDGRKLAGSAVYRDSGAMLQHGSILVDNDQPLIARLATCDVGPISVPATLAAILGRAPSPEEFAAHLFDTVRERWAPDAVELALDGALDDARRAARARFEDDGWTWRR